MVISHREVNRARNVATRFRLVFVGVLRGSLFVRQRIRHISTEGPGGQVSDAGGTAT